MYRLTRTDRVGGVVVKREAWSEAQSGGIRQAGEWVR